MSPPVALTIAGTDSGGAAGIAADLATFAAHGVHGACVVTAVTAQDTTGVREIHRVPLGVVDAQLAAVLDDLPVAAVKTGMLGSADVVVSVSEVLGARSHSRLPLVVDPVLIATSGAVLGGDAVRRAYVEHLLPVATVVTPNLDEGRALAGHDGAPAELAAELAELGPAVVLTGGVSPGPTSEAISGAGLCTDWLSLPGHAPEAVTHPAVATDNDHGTGCTHSAALAALLATGAELRAATQQAADYTTRQLRLSSTWALGRGRGPIAHLTTDPTDPTDPTDTTTDTTTDPTDKERP